MRRRPLLRGVAVAGAGAIAGSAIARHHAQSQQQQADTQGQIDDLAARQDSMEQAAPAAPAPVAAAPAPGPAAAAPASASRIQALQDLASLRDSGALTENEFAAEKARLLQA